MQKLRSLSSVRYVTSCVASAAVVLASTNGVSAQEVVDGPASEVEEQNDLPTIVVTATKRQVSLQDVGVSVSAFDGEAIQRLNATDSTELLKTVANLDISGGSSGSTNQNVFIRGIGSTGVSFNLQSGVGFYADEVVLNSPVVNVLSLYDLERIEVLRGPQNTLYGRNTTGGAVNYISVKPDVGGEANGFIDLRYGRFNDFGVEAAFGAPIGDTLAFRTAFRMQDRDGVRTNLVDGSKVDFRENYAGRLQLAWEPSSSFSAILKGHIERVRDDNFRSKPVGGFDPNNLAAPCAATGLGFGQCATSTGFVTSANPREVESDMLFSPNQVNSGGASLNMTFDFDNFSVTSITGYEENTQRFTQDADGTPSAAFPFFLDSEQDQFSQEVRIVSTSDSPFQWIVGGYYFNENTRGQTGPILPNPMGGLLVRSLAEFENTTWSAYGEIEYEVSDVVTLKGGFRYGSDNIQGQSRALLAFGDTLGLDFTDNIINGAQLPDFTELEQRGLDGGVNVFTGGTANPVGGGANRLIIVGGPTDPDAQINDTTFDDWGGMLGADFQVSDDVLVYAKWSRGFKSGRFNAAPMSIMNLDGNTGRSLGDTPVRPETVYSYEIGAKTEFADGRARLNASIFFNDYKDQQINQFLAGSFIVVNADSEIIGAEIEANFVPVDDLYIDISAGILDTKVTNAANVVGVGEELPLAPEFSGRMAIRREWEFDNGNVLSAQVDGQYTSSRFFNLANTGVGDSFFLANAQLGYEFGDDLQYRVSVFGKNIFDEVYLTNRVEGGTQAGADTGVLGMPATWGISFRAKYN